MNNIATMNMNEHEVGIRALADHEIASVNGGFAILVAAAAVTAGFGALSAAEGFGEKIGKALYYATH